MGRMKEHEWVTITHTLRNGAFLEANQLVSTLVSHIEAIELELKVSKEDEVEAVRKYGELSKEMDHITASIGYKQKEAIERLMDNVSQLQRELTEAREAKKVVLPKEAAGEIELYHGDPFKVLKALFHGEPTVQYLRMKADFGNVLSALVNGYTIEEPLSTEDKIVASLTLALEDMQVQSPVPVERLAKVLTHAIREVLAEDRQEE